MTDMKAQRDAGERATCARPQLSLIDYDAQVSEVRAKAYGADKYRRANYHGDLPAGVDPVDQFLGYVDAAMRHLGKVAKAVAHAKGTGGDVRAACAAVDDEAAGDFPASMLPHVAHAQASLAILVTCAVGNGLLPADPGEPWKASPAYVPAMRARGKLPPADPIPQKAATERGIPTASRESRGEGGVLFYTTRGLDGRRATGARAMELAWREHRERGHLLTTIAYTDQHLTGLHFMNDVIVRVRPSQLEGEAFGNWIRMSLAPRVENADAIIRVEVLSEEIGGLAADLTPGESDVLASRKAG